MEQKIISAKAAFDDELTLSKWHHIKDPQQSIKVLVECLERTHKRVRSACWGDRMRLAACDALFREAQAGVMLTQEALHSIGATVSTAPVAVEAPEPKQAESADWIQLTLLTLSSVFALISFVKSEYLTNILLGVAAVLCILMALLREGRSIHWEGPLAHIAKWLSRFALWKRLGEMCKRLLPAKKPLPSPAVRTAPPKQTVQVSVHLDAEKIKAACLHQMEVIDSNLMLFSEPSSAQDTKGSLLSLVRTMIQEQYVTPNAYPGAVSDELQRYLQDNGLILVDYSPEQAHLFQTQPMDETFTIFPAILDRDGRLMEYGMAGVQEQ